MRVHTLIAAAVLGGAIAFLTALALAAGAQAAPAPAWRIDSVSNTTVAAGADHEYVLSLTNVGEAPTAGKYELTATLPPGFTLTNFNGLSCPGALGASVVHCSSSNPVPRFSRVLLSLLAKVPSGASGTTVARFTLSGGDAATIESADPTRIEEADPPFGIDAFDVNLADSGGGPFTRAGAHPDSFITSIDFNTHTDPSPAIGPRSPVEATRDVLLELPAGLIGNPSVLERCAVGELVEGSDAGRSFCPPTSQVGLIYVRAAAGGTSLATPLLGPYPLFEMEPPPGVAARFGLTVYGTVLMLDGRLQQGGEGDYNLVVSSRKISEGLAVNGAEAVVWGRPLDLSHTADIAPARASISRVLAAPTARPVAAAGNPSYACPPPAPLRVRVCPGA